MTAIQLFQEELRIFATQILVGVENDANKATEGLKGITKMLAENPKLIRFIANEENRELFAKVKIPKSFDVSGGLDFYKQIKDLSKKFKES